MTAEDFKAIVLKEAYEFQAMHGKWPNELHIGVDWAEGFEAMFDKAMSLALFNPDSPFQKVKHTWFMGMRCFNEFWTHCVDWTEGTDRIKQALKGAA